MNAGRPRPSSSASTRGGRPRAQHRVGCASNKSRHHSAPRGSGTPIRSRAVRATISRLWKRMDSALVGCAHPPPSGWTTLRRAANLVKPCLPVAVAAVRRLLSRVAARTPCCRAKRPDSSRPERRAVDAWVTYRAPQRRSACTAAKGPRPPPRYRRAFMVSHRRNLRPWMRRHVWQEAGGQLPAA